MKHSDMLQHPQTSLWVKRFACCEVIFNKTDWISSRICPTSCVKRSREQGAEVVWGSDRSLKKHVFGHRSDNICSEPPQCPYPRGCACHPRFWPGCLQAPAATLPSLKRAFPWATGQGVLYLGCRAVRLYLQALPLGIRLVARLSTATSRLENTVLGRTRFQSPARKSLNV